MVKSMYILRKVLPHPQTTCIERRVDFDRHTQLIQTPRDFWNRRRIDQKSEWNRCFLCIKWHDCGLSLALSLSIYDSGMLISHPLSLTHIFLSIYSYLLQEKTRKSRKHQVCAQTRSLREYQQGNQAYTSNGSIWNFSWRREMEKTDDNNYQ